MGERANQEVQGGDEAESCLKLCLCCNQLHNTPEFGTREATPDGLDTWCRNCRQAARRLYYISLRRAQKRAAKRRATAAARYRRNAQTISINNHMKRAPKRTFASKYNPDALPPEERT